jgi:gliding-associated putative ABC transporter substrate-binding component GldG
MKSKIYTTTALIIGIIIVINLLATEYHLRLDLTEDQQYTLSTATKEILNNLEEPVTIKAYFSKNLPPHIGKTREDFQDLLIEYANRADGQIVYEFINPNEQEANEKEATQNGIQPVLINVREKDQVKQQKAFLGATIHLGEKKEIIPFIQPGAAMEYALSTAIKKISIDNKPTVGFISGHGEPSLSEMPQANEQLNVLYETNEITLTDSTGIPEHIKTLALIRPTDSIPETHLQKLDEFLSRGGNLLVALNRVQGDFRSMYGHGVATGLERWLAAKGVEVHENFVIDTQCGSVSVPQQFGGFTLQANVSFPFVPVVGKFANHPITSGLESVMFEFVSEVSYTGSDSTKRFTPLAFSSDLSATLTVPQMFDINKEWTENDFNQKSIPVAGALEGKLSGNTESKIVIIADGDFPINGPPQPQQQQRRLQPDNVNLLSNAIDWLSDDTGLIELRTKGAISRPIQELDDSSKTVLKYTNFLLPVILVMGYGLFRSQRNRLTRLKRMSENYEA